MMKNDCDAQDEKLLSELFEKFKRFSPEGKEKSLRMVDEIIVGENDADIVELLKKFKSALKKLL